MLRSRVWIIDVYHFNHRVWDDANEWMMMKMVLCDFVGGQLLYIYIYIHVCLYASHMCCHLSCWNGIYDIYRYIIVCMYCAYGQHNVSHRYMNVFVLCCAFVYVYILQTQCIQLLFWKYQCVIVCNVMHYIVCVDWGSIICVCVILCIVFSATGLRLINHCVCICTMLAHVCNCGIEIIECHSGIHNVLLLHIAFGVVEFVDVELVCCCSFMFCCDSICVTVTNVCCMDMWKLM